MRKAAATVAAIAATVACGNALCAPHLVPCSRIAGYQEQVERLMRAAWPRDLELLTIMYVPFAEHGIGLARTAGGFDLIRLEFDKSFWYSSWREVEAGEALANAVAVATEVHRADGGPLGAQVLDFSSTNVRVASSAVPISEQLGVALLDVFGRHVAAARAEIAAEILNDGYRFDILLAGRPCAALENPPRESDAYRMERLVRLLYNKVPTWGPLESQAIEAEVLAAIPN